MGKALSSRAEDKLGRKTTVVSGLRSPIVMREKRSDMGIRDSRELIGYHFSGKRCRDRGDWGGGYSGFGQENSAHKYVGDKEFSVGIGATVNMGELGN